MNRFFPFLFSAAAQQQQTKHVTAINAAVDHEFVSFFKDVQRDDDMWK
jgi:hypothetical protein